MLRALRVFLGTGIPVIGVNFGRVGFLSAVQPEELEDGVARAFAGELEVVELPTLEVVNGGTPHVAVNDVVVTSRRRSAGWSSSSGRSAARTSAASPATGSSARRRPARPPTTSRTAGRCSMWGLDAMATTFVAPHSLHARPLVVPRGKDVLVVNRTPDVPVVVLVDGHRVGEAAPGGHVTVAPRRGADAPRDAAGGDVRQPLPAELRRAPSQRPWSVAAVADGSCRQPRGAGLRSPSMLRRLRIENLVLIREAELELAPGLVRADRRDRRGEDDRHPGDRAAARGEGRRRRGRRRRRRGVRRGGARRAGRVLRRGGPRGAPRPPARTTSPVSSSRAA